MESIISDDVANVTVIDFENVPVDTVAEKFTYVENTTDVSRTFFNAATAHFGRLLSVESPR